MFDLPDRELPPLVASSVGLLSAPACYDHLDTPSKAKFHSADPNGISDVPVPILMPGSQDTSYPFPTIRTEFQNLLLSSARVSPSAKYDQQDHGANA